MHLFRESMQIKRRTFAFPKASLLQFTVNLDNFVANYCKSEAKQWSNYKCCSNFIKI